MLKQIFRDKESDCGKMILSHILFSTGFMA